MSNRTSNRISIIERAAAGGLAGLKSRASGNDLRGIAEAAFAAQSKPLVAPEARKAGKGKRFVIGIDPGVKTGFAVWDRERREFAAIETRDFWDVMLPLICDNEYILRGEWQAAIHNQNTEIIVEVAHNAPTFRHLKAEGQNAHTLSKIARNVGQVTREAQLIVSGLRACGYTVIEQKPLGKAKKAEDDKRQFEQQTGWTKQTSQHARDAARLCYQA